MPIANYTTEVSSLRSIQEIQNMLVKHGAKSILIDYSGSEPTGLAFIILTPHGDLPFRLPANIQKVKAVLNKQRARPVSQYDPVGQQRLQEQASRVAWRILRDWVRAQMAILETEMVTLEQIFLPYWQVNNQTLYEAMVNRHFLLTTGNKE